MKRWSGIDNENVTSLILGKGHSASVWVPSLFPSRCSTSASAPTCTYKEWHGWCILSLKVHLAWACGLQAGSMRKKGRETWPWPAQRVSVPAPHTMPFFSLTGLNSSRFLCDLIWIWGWWHFWINFIMNYFHSTKKCLKDADVTRCCFLAVVRDPDRPGQQLLRIAASGQCSNMGRFFKNTSGRNSVMRKWYICCYYNTTRLCLQDRTQADTIDTGRHNYLKIHFGPVYWHIVHV